MQLLLKVTTGAAVPIDSSPAAGPKSSYIGCEDVWQGSRLCVLGADWRPALIKA